ncbi:MAG TPA: hypothetical protein VFO01_05370 [Trebonia sp.]|nr:hypothetical protein [Trebonia sp.]
MGATDSSTRLGDPVPPAAVPPASPVRAASSGAARVPGPVLQGLLALAIYLSVFIVGFARPIASHLSVPQLRQDWTDPNFYTWAMRWWPYAVTHGLNPLYSAQIGAPHGYNLAWATTTPAIGLLFWPVTAAFGVVVAYNLMLLLVVPVTAWAGFVVTRRLTGRFWASLLAGAAYGFNPFELWHSLQGQPNLTVITLFPLMVYLVLRWWEGTLKSSWFVIWLAVLMALEFYTFNEAFADMTIVAAGTLVIGFLVAGRHGRAKVARLAWRTAVAYAAAIVLAAPYLYYAFRHYPTALVRQANIFSLSLVRLILPSSSNNFGLAPLVHYSRNLGRYSVDDYVGLPILLVLLGLAVFAWRSRLARLLAFGFLFVIAFAVGPAIVAGTRAVAPLPWGALWNLPILRSAEPSRFIIFGYLILAIALALWLTAPTATKLARAARWGLGLLAIAALFADLPAFTVALRPLPVGYKISATMHPADQLPAFLTDRLYTRYLTPGETVVIVTRRGNAGMLFQADANFYFRIAGGFINTSLTPQDALPIQVELLTYPNKARVQGFNRYIRQADIGAIIVENAWAEPWTSVFARIGMHGTSVGGVTIYPTGYGSPHRPQSG